MSEATVKPEEIASQIVLCCLGSLGMKGSIPEQWTLETVIQFAELCVKSRIELLPDAESHASELERVRRETVAECGAKVRGLIESVERERETDPNRDQLRHVGYCVRINTLEEAEESIKGILNPPPANTQWQAFNGSNTPETNA